MVSEEDEIGEVSGVPYVHCADHPADQPSSSSAAAALRKRIHPKVSHSHLF
jgi:hypothetical protein